MLMLICTPEIKPLIPPTNFNTSHVNVNLKQRQQKRNDYIISIHLMLMLILA